MKTFDGYKKQALTDVYALLAGGGHKPLSEFSMAHTHPYLPLTGGTITGNIILKGGTSPDMTYTGNVHPYIRFDNSDSSLNISLLFTDYDAYRRPAGIKLVGNQGNEWFEAANIYATTFYGTLSGNSSTATALTTSAGSATLPIYFSGGKPIACTASLVFSNLSNSGNNISVTVAGLNRTLTVGYASAASKINSRGNLTAYEEGSTTKGESGLNLYTVYNNGYPVTFGNLLHINGSGAGQLLAEWCGSSTLGHLYYRSKRDNSDNGWSTWGKVAFVTDNVTSATKLQTPRSIWGQSFNGTANVDNTLRIRQTTGNYCEGIRIQTSDGAWATIILGATTDTGTNTNAWSIHRKADNNFAISRNSSDGVNGLVMTSTGMGLGTTAPTHRLDVRGDTKITGSIRDLAIGGGIYWNPYVESATDGSDVASITLVRLGVAGGTTLVLSLMNDTNDTILFKTNGSARLYHNSYPILTTLNTYVSNSKGYINGTEITLVNNADKVDNRHAISTTPNTGIIYKAAIYTSSSLTSYWVRLASIPSISLNGEFVATIHVLSGHSNPGRSAILLVYLRGNASSFMAKSFKICCNSNYDPNRFRLYYKDSDKTSEIWYQTTGLWDGIITTVISLSSEGSLYEGLTLYNGSITAVQTPSMSTYLSALVSTITDNISGNAATATKLQTARKIWGQSFDGTGDVSGTLSGVANILFNANNTYDIGSNSTASRYIYTYWLGAKSGLKLELGANNSNFGLGLCIDTNLNVGIGTNTPSYKLHINGTLGVNNIATFNVNNQWLSPSVLLIGRLDDSKDASKAIIGVTDGNLHIDAYHNKELYLNYYNKGRIRLGYQTGSYYISENGSYYSGTSASASNADTVDGYHEYSFLRYRDSTSTNGLGTLWSLIGIRSYHNALPDGLSGLYTYGQVISFPGNGSRMDIYTNHNGSADTVNLGIWWRSGWNDDKKTWRRIIDSGNIGSLSVNYATYSRYVYCTSGKYLNFQWSGLSSQPTWLFGSNDGLNVYVWNPSNFSVNYANSAGNADTVDGYHASKFPYINNSGIWKVYGNSAAAALADNTAGLSSWAFGESRNSGITYLGILKPSTATCGISAHGTIAVFGQGDTHLGIASDYSGANLQVFGGNADKIVWRKKIAFADGTGVSGTWGISITGNAVTASKLGTSTVGATNVPIYLNGGTPTVVNLNSTANNLINNLTTGTSTPTDADYYISQYVGGGTTTITYHRRPHSSLYAYIKGKAEGTWSISITGNAATATNADKVDGYHANSLWRSDGATWNPGANVSLNASANNQEWSFDIRKNGYTGCYWHVWDSALNSLLKVNADNGKVYAPYNFVGNLEGNASSSSKWLTARTFTIGNTSKNIDGSGNVSWSLSEIGAAFSSHSHNYAANENYGGFTKSGRLPISGFYQSNESESGGNAPWTSWMHLINCLHNNRGNNYALLIAASFYNNNIFKIRVTNGNVNNAWRDIIHSGNIGSQSVAYASSAGNADTVDGLHANAFATASHSHPYLPLSGGTMTGLIVGNNKGGSWILGRANAALYLPRTTTDDWHPVVGFKTKTGSWEFGNIGNDDFATFSWESDSNYSSGTNANTRINLRAISGTIALTSDIPTKSSWNYDDRYSKLGHTHDNRYYTESEINSKLGAYLPLSGGTMTGALNFKNGTWNLMGDDAYIGDCNVGGMIGVKGANAATPGFVLYNNSGTLLGKLYASGGTLIWSGDTIQATTFNGNATTASNADKLDGYHASSFATSSHTHSYITIPTCSSLDGNSNNFSVEYAGGSNSVATKPSGVDAFGVMRLRTAGGWYGQIMMSANAAPGIYYRNANGLTSSIGWIKLLDSSNSSVSGGGSAWGSSITVKINGTSKTLTIPSNPNTDYRVTQSETTTTNYRPLVLGYINVSTAGSGMTGSVTNQVYLSNKFYVQPSTGNLYATTFVGTLSGNATTASKWATARTLTLTGSVTGSVYIDGSSNVTLTTTTNHTHNWANIEGKPNTFTPSSHTHDDRYYTESEVNNLLSNKLNTSNFNWTNLSGKLVAGNEFNIVNDGFNTSMWFNHSPINDRSKTASINGYHFGNGAGGYTSIKASGFIKNGSNSNYVLLGDGGHKAISDFATTNHTHAYLPLSGGTMTGTIKYGEKSYEIIRTGGDNTSYRSGLKYSWSGSTTIALWGKHSSTQFVWHAGTDFSSVDVNGTTTRTYDFQVGRVNGTLEALIGGNKIWHAGNDGSGSGLDADKLDGYHASAFALSSHTHNYLPLSGGTMNANARISFNDDGALYIGRLDNSLYVYFQDMASQDGADYWLISQEGSAYFRGTVTATTFSGALSGNATTATTASKLGSSTVGSSTRHFYLNAGTATASTATVGGTAKPMYLKSGVMTALTVTVGSATKPVYLSGGTITACSSSLTDYLPLTGGRLSGDLYIDNAKTPSIWARYTGNTAIRICASSSATHIQIGNSAWNANVPLYISGPNTNLGSTLYLKFSTVDASGNIYATHFYENSDIRYKKILKNLSINSNTIATLPLFDFEWIENNTIGTGTSAQAVLKILPNIVSGTDKLTLDYGVLGTIAGITACKELVTLKSELLQLKEKVKLLEDKLRKYENI